MNATRRFLWVAGLSACFGCAPVAPGDREVVQSTIPDYARKPLSVVLNEKGEQRFLNFVVRKDQLNEPVSPKRVYFYVETSTGYEQSLTLVIKVGEKIEKHGLFIVDKGQAVPEHETGLLPGETHDTQAVPYICEWQLRGPNDLVTHEWLCGFVRNLDGTYHTAVNLPISDLNRSWLEVYFEDVDGDGAREDWTFFLDMTKYNWQSRPGAIVVQ